LVWKPKGKRLLGKRTWEDNIKMALKGIGFGGENWIQLAQDRDRWLALRNTIMKLRVP
jgi:hypothetical protein